MVNTIDGLKEGVGDIVGGLLGGVIAFLTAYFTVRWQFDRDEARRAEEKQTAAETLLMAVTALVPAIESIDAAMRGTTAEDTLIFHKEPWILPRMVDICDALAAWENPDAILGREIRMQVRGLKFAGENSKRMFIDAQQTAWTPPLGIPFSLVFGARRRSLKQIKAISGLLDELIQSLDTAMSLKAAS